MFTRVRFLLFIRLGFLVTGTCLIYGFFIEPKTLAVRQVTVKSKTWSGAPIKIALISDIHIGSWHVDADRVKRLVEKTNSHHPDITLLAGDYVNGHVPYSQSPEQFNLEIDKGIGNLGQLSAPLGVYAVLGNHDAWYSEPRILSLLQQTNIGVLNNQSKIIGTKDVEFCLIGLADSYTGVRDRTAFSECGMSINIIAFMHSPDSFDLLRSDTNLALAGHTHGGQINIPLIGRRITSTSAGRKYAYGELDLGGILAFVTSGIGTSILPARFRVPPEIVIITLGSP